MTDPTPPSRSPQKSKNKSLLAVLVLPFVSCLGSSVIGLVLGQIGNQVYKILGPSAACLSVPGFIVLFLLTFGLSFLGNKLLRKMVLGSTT
jgi:hypothetical protein